MKRTFIVGTLLLWAAGASAIPKPKPDAPFYSLWTQRLTNPQQSPKQPVFIGNHVKKPGAYEFKSGLTIVKLVKIAGGLDLSKFTSSAGTSWAVMHRKSQSDPEAHRPTYSCRILLASKPSFKSPDCKRELQPGDLVIVDPPYVIP